MRVRFKELRRRFDDYAAAYALGFGLGLVDAGFLSAADGERLVEALVPEPEKPLPAYRTGRFWLYVALSASVVGGLVAYFESRRPSYPTLTAPLLAGPVAAVPPAEEAPSGEKPIAAPTRSVVDDAVAGTLSVPEAVAAIRELPAANGSVQAELLFSRLSTVELRLQALNQLLDTPGGRFDGLLRAALNSKDHLIVDRALGLIAGRGNYQLVPEVSRLLARQDAQTRAIAIDTLGMLVEPLEADRLIPFLRDTDEGVRGSARRALTRVFGKDLGADPKKWWERMKRFKGSAGRTRHQ
ncbi:MAG: HEAT repeat domain-containing protein [Myxococcales bacterium]|nr:HEAT repeat domain-containing protein [Myxococcales bacterium]